MAGDIQTQKNLRNAVTTGDHEIIIIDTPSSACVPLISAIYASDIVVVPVCYERWNLQGFQQLYALVEEARSECNREIHVVVVPTMVTLKEAEKVQDSIPRNVYTIPIGIKRANSVKTSIDRARMSVTPIVTAVDEILKRILVHTSEVRS